MRRDWHDMGASTVVGPDWPADAVAAATRDAARLVALARTLVDSGVLTDACGSAVAWPDAELLPDACDLARALAETPGARALPPTAGGDPAVTAAAFAEALTGAGSAIYICRRVLHPTGRCLFSGALGTAAPAGDATDLCARVLLVAARLGGAHPH